MLRPPRRRRVRRLAQDFRRCRQIRRRRLRREQSQDFQPRKTPRRASPKSRGSQPRWLRTSSGAPRPRLPSGSPRPPSSPHRFHRERRQHQSFPLPLSLREQRQYPSVHPSSPFVLPESRSVYPGDFLDPVLLELRSTPPKRHLVLVPPEFQSACLNNPLPTVPFRRLLRRPVLRRLHAQLRRRFPLPRQMAPPQPRPSGLAKRLVLLRAAPRLRPRHQAHRLLALQSGRLRWGGPSRRRRRRRSRGREGQEDLVRCRFASRGLVRCLRLLAVGRSSGLLF